VKKQQPALAVDSSDGSAVSTVEMNAEVGGTGQPPPCSVPDYNLLNLTALPGDGKTLTMASDSSPALGELRLKALGNQFKVTKGFDSKTRMYKNSDERKRNLKITQ
jgi:hypothetical protein